VSGTKREIMSEKIRVGIIGAGQIAQEHLKGYRQIEGAEVVALSDINAAAAARSAEEYGIPHTYRDFRELLAREDIQAVDVCLHNNLHAPVAIAALEAGKNAYSEKPMAGSYHDARAMLETARRTGLKLHVQLATLYAGGTRAAKTLIDEGQLGELYHARSTGFRRRGRPFVDGYGTANFVQKKQASGGALYDMGVYHISQLLYLLGNPEVTRITGTTYQKLAMDEAKRLSSSYDVEELGLGFVHFVGGATLDIIEAWAINLGSIEGPCLVGTEGGVRLEPFEFYRNLGKMEINSTVNGTGGGYSGHLKSQEHWIAALQGKETLLPTAEVALNTMLISEGIYLSEKLGREVTAEEVRELSVSTAVKL